MLPEARARVAKTDSLPVKRDLQMHTAWGDGSGTIEDMARAASDRGYDYIAITAMYFVGIRDVWALIRSSPRKTAFIGVEFPPHGGLRMFGVPLDETANRLFESDGFSVGGAVPVLTRPLMLDSFDPALLMTIKAGKLLLKRRQTVSSDMASTL